MKVNNTISKRIAGVLMGLAGVFSTVLQAASPIEIQLSSLKQSYLDNELIELFIQVRNVSGSELYVSEGFMAQDFHLKLNLSGPDGVIRPSSIVGQPEPLGPRGLIDATGVLRPAVPCDRVPAEPDEGYLTERLFDLRQFYAVSEPGGYTAAVEVELQVFSEFVELGDTGEIFCFLDDAQSETFNPVPTNPINFSITPLVELPESEIQVSAELFEIGPGQKPVVSQTPLRNMRIELYEMESIPADFLPAGHKTYALISDSNRVDPIQTRFTNKAGAAGFSLVEQAEYLLIGIYQSSTDTRYVGATLKANDQDWTDPAAALQAHLKVMVLPNGDTAPGRTQRLRGSELLITQPDYIEWDSTEELYPFVFESVGDWGVNTTVEPPEGFVSDAESLSAEVTDELEAVQFTVIDVGTTWIDFDVTYDVQHKSKKIKIKDKVGMRLAKKLAKQKNLGIYGETEDPGDFVGGKKIKKDDDPSTTDDGKDKKGKAGK